MSSIDTIHLSNGDMSLGVIPHGACTHYWRIGDRDLIMSYPTADHYPNDPYYVGAIVGPVANRISGRPFQVGATPVTLNNNEGDKTLHGGAHGLFQKHWSLVERQQNRAVLSCFAPDGEDGFPGNVRFEVTIELGTRSLSYVMTAETDAPTPISLAQHNYYTLGLGDTSQIGLRLTADRRLKQAHDGTTDGTFLAVNGTGLDFSDTGPRRIGSALFDDYLTFPADRDTADPVAEMVAPDGLRLGFFSDQLGAQVYSGHGLGAPFAAGQGLCFEPSGYPNAVHFDHFPSVIVTPDRPYRQVLKIEVSE